VHGNNSAVKAAQQRGEMPNAMMEDQVPAILNTLPARISDVVKPWAQRTPDRPALTETSGTWTYGQLDSAIKAAQTCLLECGIRPGDRVIIVGENSRAFAAVVLASAGIDAWPVVVNPLLSKHEVAQIQGHCGARRIISVSPLAAEHAKQHGTRIREFLGVGTVGLGPLNDKAEPEDIDDDVPNRVAVLIYTSGTTGLPKGVMLTHRNVLFIAAVSAQIRGLTPNDRLYGILPMTHAVGLSTVLLGTLLSGARLYLSPHFDPMSARVTLEKEKITVMLGVPALFAQMVHYARLRGVTCLNLPALRIISTSGAPLHPSIKTSVESLFGRVLHNNYGVTECGPTVSQTRIESSRTDTSVGQVLPGIEIKLTGTNHNLAAEGEVGELSVRGPNIMKGYYRAPEETAAAIDQDGWFNTQDLARLENGNLFIVGRTKELIIRSGFNVYPAEVEAVLNAHPQVVQSAVVGRAAEQNEEVIAFVQRIPASALTAPELAEYAAQHLGPYKRPSEIVLVETMPMTSTGKIAKAELARMAALSSSQV
jgi:long-chain acyl-CoA synthetase